MNTPIEYQTSIVMSTSHLPEELAKEWDLPYTNELGDSVVDRVATQVPYGYRSSVSEQWSIDLTEDYPRALEVICAWVRKYTKPGTCYIIFDCDGPVYAGLPTYDW
jgi:hypothetical protein